MQPTFLLLFSLVFFAASTLAATPMYFVAMSGNDAWSGTLPEANAEKTDGPFATLTKARDALRTAAGEQGLAEGGFVYVRGGTYYLDAALALEARDSGAKDRPVVWQAFKDEQVRLVGGPFVPAFARECGSEKWKADLAGLKLPDGPIGQLFYSSKRLTPARWPNAGEDDMPGGKWAFVAGSGPASGEVSFVYAGDRPGTWANPSTGEVSIRPVFDWSQLVAPIASVDAAAKKIVLGNQPQYSIERGRRYFVQHIAEELDRPGEWFYDAAAKALYLMPPNPEFDLHDIFTGFAVFLPSVNEASHEVAAPANPNGPKNVFPATPAGCDKPGAALPDAEVVVPVLDSILTVNGAHHVIFIGFTMEATRGDGVVFKNARECMIARCIVRNTFGTGIAVEGGNAVRVWGNNVYETGKGGVSVTGGDRKALLAAGHSVVNNDIHHFGRIWQTYTPGVAVNGVGNGIQHNAIHDGPHIGIWLTGNNHQIEYNDIHHVCMEVSDNGAFYMGRDWTQRGNFIRFNKFHDIYGFGLEMPAPNEEGKFVYRTPLGGWAVYLDDCSSGTTIHGNIFYRVPLCGVMIGGGRDNVVSNNVFIDCSPALHIDARWDAFPYGDLQQGLAAMNYKQPPYSEAYPELLTIDEDPRKPANNKFTQNIVAYYRDDYRGLASMAPNPESAVLYDLDWFDPATTVFDNNFVFHNAMPIRIAQRPYKTEEGHIIGWEDWKKTGLDANSVVGNPRFFDLDNDDFALDYESHADELGFQAIPDTRIGCYNDELRASWPIPADTRRDGNKDRHWVVDVDKQ